MNGIEFERLVADRMRSLGWDASITPTSGDFGADIICTSGAAKLAIQCKCYDDSNYVGPAAVGEALRGKANYNAKQGAIVYRGRPTKQTRKEAQNCDIGLFHVHELTPGCDLDRTREGAELRRRREQQEAEEERLRRCREEQQYKVELTEFERKNPKWLKASKSHERWKEFGLIALIIGLLTLFGGAIPVGVIALIFAGYAYFGTSPGPRPWAPVKPEWISQPRKSHDEQRPPSPAAVAAKSLRLLGYRVDPNSGRWKLADKRGGIHTFTDEELVDFSRGFARVACIGCGIWLRVPAQKRLRISCPRCGLAEAYST